MSPRPQNDVNQCGAEITQVYNDMLLDPAALDIDQAEAVLDECAATLDKSLPKKDDLNLLDSTPYCPSPAPSPGASGRRRQLSHAEGDPIEASINYTYAECFADHALATPCVGSPHLPPPPAPEPNACLPVENVRPLRAYCAPPCCPPGTKFGENACASKYGHSGGQVGQTADMIGDKVKTECLNFQTFALSKAVRDLPGSPTPRCCGRNRVP
jgi:hypothetical protein